MIKLLSHQIFDGVNYSTWEDFEFWLSVQTEYQFDIETNVTDHWCTKKVKTLQFGDVENSLQYVIDWAYLTEEQKLLIKKSLEDWNICKLIHNAAFEYIVMRFHQMEIHNVYCTMVAEKVLQGGVENADYSLADLAWSYCNVTIDKSLQTSFGDGILTKEKVEYAATDCMYLAEIRKQQYDKIMLWKTNLVEDPSKVLELEMQSLLAFSDCTYYGVAMNVEKWRENIALAQPIVDAAKLRLDGWLSTDLKLKEQAIKLGYLLEQDKAVYNLNSHQTKIKLLQLIFPDIPGATLVVLKGYVRDNPVLTSDTEKLNILVSLISKDTVPMEEYLMKYHRDYLVENELLLLAGSVQINWNSQVQVLSLLKIVEPKLKSLSAEDVAKCLHPIFKDLEEYKDSLKLLSTYGETFIEKYTEPDGMVRTNYNQVVSTGRVSSLRPNMQNIPSKEHLENRYRNAFIWKPGFTFVDSDYAGQELCCIADMAKDPVWFEAIKRNEDLHSVTASMVFGSKWKDGVEDTCVFESTKQKCKCKKHKSMRTATKTVNFGLAFGMSEFKLSSTIDITVKEAKTLIGQYFRTFPKIKQLLEFLGNFGVKNGYIITKGPYFRRRSFPYWHLSKSFIQEHIEGITYNSALGSVERQSKNLPIQGLAANMTKLAMWLTYKWIRDNNYVDRINILLQVHDQITTVCEDELTEMWTKKLDDLMVEAGLIILPSGIQKADTQSSSYWTK